MYKIGLTRHLWDILRGENVKERRKKAIMFKACVKVDIFEA
jgi:hypothetical protein